MRVDWAEYRRALQVIAADDVVWSWTLRGRSGSQLELRSNTPLDLEQQADWARAHERVIAELQAE